MVKLEEINEYINRSFVRFLAREGKREIQKEREGREREKRRVGEREMKRERE